MTGYEQPGIPVHQQEVPGDLSDPEHTRAVVQQAVDEFGRLDVRVPDAAYQSIHENLEDFTDEEFEHTFCLNIGHCFHLVKAALPHLKPGASIVATSPVNADTPTPTLAPYSATKAAIANVSTSLAQMLGPRGIRVNSVAAGSFWTPLIPATMPPDQVEDYGSQAPLGRTGQPAELAPVYVLLLDAGHAGLSRSGTSSPTTAASPWPAGSPPVRAPITSWPSSGPAMSRCAYPSPRRSAAMCR